MSTTFITKLGTTRAGERTRIWIEGNRLLDAGFAAGATFTKTWHENSLELIKARKSQIRAFDIPRSGWATVSGKGSKPIIDITGAKVVETFGKYPNVEVTFYEDGVIEIRGVK